LYTVTDGLASNYVKNMLLDSKGYNAALQKNGFFCTDKMTVDDVRTE
jgi:hypothetical protein